MGKSNWAAVEEAMYSVAVGEGVFLRRDINLLPSKEQWKAPKAEDMAKGLGKWESVWHVQRTERSQHGLSILTDRETGKM